MRSFWTLTFFLYSEHIFYFNDLHYGHIKILTIYFTLMTCITGTIINQIRRFNVNYSSKTYDLFLSTVPLWNRPNVTIGLDSVCKIQRKWKKLRKIFGLTHDWWKILRFSSKKKKKLRKVIWAFSQTRMNWIKIKNAFHVLLYYILFYIMFYVCTEIKKRRDGNIWYAKRERHIDS